MPLNMSGKWFNAVSYGLNEEEEIDYDAMERKAHEAKPVDHCWASAYHCALILSDFTKWRKDVGAIFLVDMAHYSGLIAAGVYPNCSICRSSSPPPPNKKVSRTTEELSMKVQHEKQSTVRFFRVCRAGR
jgi:glycine/serine hydroxymethyltransferase